MFNTLKPFVVLCTYVVLYAVSYMFISLVFALTFWVNYLSVVQNTFMIIALIVGIAAHIIYGAEKMING